MKQQFRPMFTVLMLVTVSLLFLPCLAPAQEIEGTLTFRIADENGLAIPNHQVALTQLNTMETVVKYTDQNGEVVYVGPDFPTPLQCEEKVEFDANPAPDFGFWESLVTAELDNETQNRLWEVKLGHNINQHLTIGGLGLEGIGGELTYTRTSQGWWGMNPTWSCFTNLGLRMTRYLVISPNGAFMGAMHTLDDQFNHSSTVTYRGWLKLTCVNCLFSSNMQTTLGDLSTQLYTNSYTNGPTVDQEKAIRSVGLNVRSTWKKIKIETQMDIQYVHMQAYPGWLSNSKRTTYTTYVWAYQMRDLGDQPTGYPITY